ncbi:MAG: RelA/SpoT domain-containing protein [Desulfococcus multivorans]|nr:RelA/SpoT domain-containing protein [Desulfococcus multivorans]
MDLDENYVDFIRNNFPEPFNRPETYQDFILPKIQQHDTLCTAVIAEVKKKILPSLISKYHYRIFCRIDADHKTKQPISIIDKMIRPSKPETGKAAPEPLTLDNFTTTMTDLARFRIVCNFLHDVDTVVEALINAEALNRMFSMNIKSTMDVHPTERKSAERSVKLILEHKSNPGLFLEIQVMTQLSEAWDKKDHFLVYEVRRRFPDKGAENFPDYLDAKMHAMGELLYVADNYFEGLRASKEKENKEEASGS